MPRANAEHCPHPFKQLSTPSFGALECGRCCSDLTPPGRVFEHRAGERTTFRQGDRVHVKAHGALPAFKGVFEWAETELPSGLAYCICEKEMYQLNKQWFEGTVAVRFIRPEHVRHDDGVRARRRREEEVNAS